MTNPLAPEMPDCANCINSYIWYNMNKIEDGLSDALRASHVRRHILAAYPVPSETYKQPVNKVLDMLLDHLKLEIKTETETTKLVKKTEVKK